MKLVGVLEGQPGLLNLPHEPHDEAACSHEGVDDVYALVGKGAAKFFAEDFLHRFDDELHNGLRCIDDAVGIGYFDREPLEELLIHGVQEALFLGEVANGSGGGLDSAIEAVERLQEFIAAERLRGQG